MSIKMKCVFAVTVLMLSISSIAQVSTALVVGETQSTFNSADGSASLSIPIYAFPGRAGMTPEMSLSYSSNAGNSEVGFGWSLQGLTTISRCGSSYAMDKRVLGVTLTTKDNFCLGGQRLTRVGGSNQEIHYRTQLESHSKIVSSGDYKNPSSFKVYTKAGQVFELKPTRFGTLSQAVNWTVSSIKDKVGNSIQFEYTYIENRQYVTTITYAGGHKLSFEYENRPDITTLYAYGQQTKVTKRLKRVHSYYLNRKVRILTLSHKSNYDQINTSYVSEVQECATKDNGYNQECFQPKKFGYQRVASTASEQSLGSIAVTPGYNASMWHFDIDGDGDTDSVYDKKGGGSHHEYWVSLTGSDKKFLTYKWFNSNTKITTNGQMLPLDVNDDGRVDLVFNKRSSREMKAILNLPNKGYKEVSLGYRHIKDHSKKKGDDLYPADVNGDGRADLMYFNHGTNNMRVLLNNGNSTFSDSLWGNDIGTKDSKRWVIDINGDSITDVLIIKKYAGEDAFVAYLGQVDGNAPVEKRWGNLYKRAGWNLYFPMDINSDGLIDIVYNEGGSRNYRAYLNTGSSFYYRLIGERAHKVGWENRHWPMDADGDGFTDIVYNRQGSNDYRMLRNNGNNTFTDSFWARKTVKVGYNGLHRVVDTDGDGVQELVFNKHRSLEYKKIERTSSPNERKLVSITGSHDNVTNITYGLLTDPAIYSKFTTPVTFPIVNTISPQVVVKSVMAENGIMGRNTTNYRYGGMIGDAQGGGSGGFRTIVETYPQQDKIKRTFFNQYYPHTGKIHALEELVGNQIVNQQWNTYEQKDLSNKRTESRLLRTHFRTHELGKPNNFIKEIITYYTQYDNFGNNTEIVTNTKANGITHITKVNNVFTNNASTWSIGRLTKATTLHGSTDGVTPSVTKNAVFGYNSDGLLNYEAVQSNDGSIIESSTHKYYNNYGQVKKTEVKNRSENGTVGTYNATKSRVSTTEYNLQGLPTKQCNAANLCQTITYDNNGNVLTTQSANGNITRLTYDAFGRLKTTTNPDGTQSSVTNYFASSAGGRCGTLISTAKTCSVVTVSGVKPSIVQKDVLGRDVRKITQAFDDRKVYTDSEYNSQGQLLRISRPYYLGNEIYWGTSKYDKLGRVVELTEPSVHGTYNTIKTIYDGLTKTLISGSKQLKKVQISDGLDNIVEIREEEGASVKYEYTGDNQLRKTTLNDDPDTAITIYYDEFSRKSAMVDPNMGTWFYRYNGFGELIQQIDAKNQYINTFYDELGRKKSENVNGGNVRTWEYGTSTAAQGYRGKLLSVKDSAVVTTFKYDKLGRTTQTTKTIDGANTFTTKTQYDNLGRVKRLDYPGTQGFLQKIFIMKMAIWHK